MQPLVSIIIPCYNYAQFLPDAIASVVEQRYSNWEILVVNDGSPDNTTDVAQRLIAQYSDCAIQLIEKPNTGVADSRNQGMQRAQGDYFLLLDADDKIHPAYLETAVEIFQQHPEVGFIYVDAQHFGTLSQRIRFQAFDLDLFLRMNQATVSSLFRREIYEQTGGMKPVMSLGWEDWEFWISACELGWQGYHLNQPYLFYRTHNQGSRTDLLNNLVTMAVYKAKLIGLHPGLYTLLERVWSQQIFSWLEPELGLNLAASPQAPPILAPAPAPEASPPFLSVMVVVAGVTRYLEKTLEHLLAHLDLGRVQVAVVLGASPDTVATIAAPGQFSSVDFHYFPADTQISTLWNQAIQKARGRWLHILGDGDLLQPSYFQRLQGLEQQCPQAEVLYSRSITINDDDHWVSLSPLAQDVRGLWSGNIQQHFAAEERVRLSVLLVKRELYQKLGGFLPELGQAAAWEMAQRLAAHAAIYYEPEPLVQCRDLATFVVQALPDVRSGANVAQLTRAIAIAQTHYPDDRRSDWQQAIRERWALAAVQMARLLLLHRGDIPGAMAQLQAALDCHASVKVGQAIAHFLGESALSQSLLIALLKLATSQQNALEWVTSDSEAESPGGTQAGPPGPNLLLVPNWTLPEPELLEEVMAALRQFLQRPDRLQAKLWIDSRQVSDQDGELLLTSALFNLTLTEGWELDAEFAIELTGQLSEADWQALLAQTQPLSGA